MDAEFAGAPVSDTAGRDAACRWLEAVPARHSRRSYTGEPVPAADLDALESLAARWRPWHGARAVVLREAPPNVFVGVIGMYGGISHAPSAIAFIGDEHDRAEKVGYTGEALVLEAASRAIDTCWVGGLFSARAVGSHVSIGPRERIYAVCALGRARDRSTTKERILFGAARAKTRRTLDEIAPGHEDWPEWACAAVSAVRVAPSAMNRQPWRFALDGMGVTLASAGADTPRTSKHLDCGIAMLHFELGALGAGVTGSWELLDGPGVARFTPTSG